MKEYQRGTKVWMLRDWDTGSTILRRDEPFVVLKFIPANRSELGIAAYLATNMDGRQIEIPASYCYPAIWGKRSKPEEPAVKKSIKKLSKKPVKKLRKPVRK